MWLRENEEFKVEGLMVLHRDGIHRVFIRGSSFEECMAKLVEFFREAREIPEVARLMEKYGIEFGEGVEG
ncbi:MAG: hypothetical protein DRG31_02355 [Deltaproteobacteria bacterium]|nr:MAG: hypothetical protein DRG31_02355 [Deltaproteobacteria bacterium]